MTDLIARLEAATEGSRELDYLIHCALGWIDHDQGGWTRGDETTGEGWPAYTSSLDAALALAGERAYPVLLEAMAMAAAHVLSFNGKDSDIVNALPRFIAITALRAEENS